MADQTSKGARPGETCADCIHYEAAATDPSSGRCRRNPPAIVNDTLEANTPEARFVSMWPIVTKNDWCGEFVPVEAPANSP
jgi:hypothetical protein